MDPVEWTDTQAEPGKSYGYYIVPVHPDMKSKGEPVQGEKTKTIYVQVPEASEKNGIWDKLPDWLHPGDRTDNPNGPDQDNNEGKPENSAAPDDEVTPSPTPEESGSPDDNDDGEETGAPSGDDNPEKGPGSDATPTPGP